MIEGYQIGANNYIKKPFIAEEMDAHIRGLLSMKEGRVPRINPVYIRLAAISWMQSIVY